MAIPSTQNAPEIRALADTFMAASVGDMVTYDALSAAIGRDIQRVRYLIPSALKRASAECGAIFGNVRGEGYLRLPAEKAHTLGATARRRIRRISRRTASIIQDVTSKANGMSDEAFRKAITEMNSLSLLAHISRDKAQPTPPADTKPEPVGVVAKRFLERIGAV